MTEPVARPARPVWAKLAFVAFVAGMLAGCGLDDQTPQETQAVLGCRRVLALAASPYDSIVALSLKPISQHWSCSTWLEWGKDRVQ